MKPENRSSAVAIALVLIAVAISAPPALAQQITGKLGSPDATATIKGDQLPAPDPKFGGVIKNDALQSKAWWAPRVTPPKQAPNILLIITDDAGFGVPGTFGGVIPTPTMNRVAKNGLRYNNIHSTALGMPKEVAFFNGVAVPVDLQMKFYDVWRTEQTYNHMPTGWSWAFDTPLTGSSKTHQSSAASGRTWRSPGRRASRTRAASASSSCT